MSFVLIRKDAHFETYRIRCDHCSEETQECEVPRWDTQHLDYQKSTRAEAVESLKKLTRDCDYTRVGQKHLCQACEALRQPARQLTLLDKGPPNREKPRRGARA